MDKRLFGVVLLLIFLSREVMATLGPGRMCRSTSHGFRGTCILRRNRNCETICVHEGFQGGHCSLGSCICSKSCHGGGGGWSRGGGGGWGQGGGGGGQYGGGRGGGEGGHWGGGMGGGEEGGSDYGGDGGWGV